MVDTPSRDRIRTITIPPVGLEGMLGLPTAAKGIVLFAHGSGSGRLSPSNNFVAQALRDNGLATLLFDLLTVDQARPPQRLRYRVARATPLDGDRLGQTR